MYKTAYYNNYTCPEATDSTMSTIIVLRKFKNILDTPRNANTNIITPQSITVLVYLSPEKEMPYTHPIMNPQLRLLHMYVHT